MKEIIDLSEYLIEKIDTENWNTSIDYSLIRFIIEEEEMENSLMSKFYTFDVVFPKRRFLSTIIGVNLGIDLWHKSDNEWFFQKNIITRQKFKKFSVIRRLLKMRKELVEKSERNIILIKNRVIIESLPTSIKRDLNLEKLLEEKKDA